MKKMLAVVLLAVGMGVASAWAQAGAVKVNVPFQFFIGDRGYEPGLYRFVMTKETVSLEDHDGNPLAVAMANHVSDSSVGKTGEVVFDCYEKQCFLSQVWSPTEHDGRKLLWSKLQTELAARKPGTYMALAADKK